MPLLQGFDAQVEMVREKLYLDYNNQLWMLIWDCYSVHIAKSTLSAVKAEFPRMIPIFIDVTWTPWLQPLDISVNGIFKSMLQNMAGQWLSQQVSYQLKTTLYPTAVKIYTSLTSLEAPFCGWVAQALQELADRPEVIERGWRQSRIGEAFSL